MALDRLLKYINIVIAVVALGLLGIVYWIAWRPLPKTSGTVRAPVSGRALVTRDPAGVPHIQAASIEDLLFVQGYVTAQDRLWQMDGLRRYAAGDLAEVFGPSLLESDRESRRLRMRRIAEDDYISMPASDRILFAAYARGVNEFLRTHGSSLPLEFTLLGYRPRPWSAVDCLLVGLHMFRTLTTTWRDEMVKRALLEGGDAAKVNLLMPPRSGSEAQPGSNAWTVSGKRTASGRPMLSNDMHLEFSMPGIWYMAHLQGPGLNVAGVSLPGVPGIIVGHNERIAWGVTNLHFDVQDLYIESFDDRSGSYRFRGQAEQARREREVIRVRGGAPVELTNWVTRHGPLFVTDERVRLALKWTAAEHGAFGFPFLQINRARNWSEFTAALARFPGPGQNFVYADLEGNIGYHAAGRLPIRKNRLGDLPVDGSSGENEWEGYIPFEQLPASFNPPQGLIVTANQNPFPRDYPYPVNGNFASHYRSKQIRELLSARPGLKPEDMLAIQRDVYSAFSHFLAGQFAAAYERRKANNPGLADAIALLRSWNGQMEKDKAAPLIVTFGYQHLRRAIADRAAPGKGSVWDYQMTPAVIENLLRARPKDWSEDFDLLLLRALADGVEEGRRIQGRDLNKWIYGDYIGLTIAHPVGPKIPVIGPVVAKYFSIGPVAMSGSSTTVKQTTRRLGPSMRMTAVVGDWDNSLLNIVTGQSGQILSKHYKDQWPAYYEGTSFRMQFRKIEEKGRLEFLP